MISTAYWIAAARARETARPDALFRDPYAAALAGPRGRLMLERSEAASGRENVFLPIRTRHFDDVLLRAVADGRARQVVLLGAGFDTRAFRLELPEAVTVFEIDRAEIFADKERILGAAGARPRCGRRTVAADLAGDWAGALRDAGFHPATPTVWLAEGLLFYLSAPAVDALLRDAATASPTGSLFAADLFGTGLLRLPHMQPAIAPHAPFCTDDPAVLLTAAGWTPLRITGPGAADANYGRLPGAVRPPAADPSMRIYLLTATR